MVVETALIGAAGKIVAALIASPAVQGRALKIVGKEPMTQAVGRALQRAASAVEKESPEDVGGLFDASFLEREALPVLVAALTRGAEASPQDLAQAYARSLPGRENLRQAEADRVLPAATLTLTTFLRSAQAETALTGLFDSKAMDDSAATLKRIDDHLSGGAADRADEISYLDWVINRNLYLDTRGTFGLTKQVKLRLDQVFITLDAHTVRNLDEPSTDPRKETPKDDERPDDDLAFIPIAVAPDRDRPQPWARVLAEHSHVVVLGDPGGGKTTLLRHLALIHAQALLRHRDGGPNVGEEARLPILIRVADYAQDGTWRSAPLAEFLADFHRVAECPARAVRDLFDSHLAAGDCLVMIDGLDEIAGPDDRVGIVRKIEEFITTHTRAGNRFVVTSRVAGYAASPLTSDFQHFRALDMDRPQIEAFLRRWCRAVEDSLAQDASAHQRTADAQAQVEGILAVLDLAPGVGRLAANPLMLRILALIYREGGYLPQQRIHLYELAAGTMASTWRIANYVPQSALAGEGNITRYLGILASWMHTNRPSGLATHDQVFDVLAEAWARNTGHLWDADNPTPAVVAEVEKFLDQVRVHTGLLVEKAPRVYGFFHLTFEEYYAARHLVERARTRVEVIRAHLHDPRWQETILLAIGYVGRTSPADSDDLIRMAILGRDHDLTASPYEELLGRDFLFAMRCLGDNIPVDQPLAHNLINQAVEEVVAGTGRGRYNAYRRAVSDRLALLLKTDYAPIIGVALARALPRAAARTGLIQLIDRVAEDATVIHALLTALADQTLDPVIRSWVAAALRGGVARPEVTQALLTAIADQTIDPVIRQEMVYVLVPWSDQPEVAHALLTALADHTLNQAIRSMARRGLRQDADQPEVAHALLTALADHTLDPAIRQEAARALGGAADQPEVAHALLTALADHTLDPAIRQEAARALGGAADQPEVAHALLTALADQTLDPAIRQEAAYSLGGATRQPEVAHALLTALADQTLDPAIRQEAAGALGRAAHHPEVTQALLTTLANQALALAIRRQAAHALGWAIEQPEVTRALLSTLADQTLDLVIREAAARTLRDWSGAAGVTGDLLIAVADQSLNPDIREQAASALRRAAGQPELTAALLSTVADDTLSPDIRDQAASALSMAAAQPEVTAALLTTLADQTLDLDLRDHTAHALLRRARWLGVTQTLLTTLADQTLSPAIREQAAYALGGAVEQPEVTQALLTTLTDQTLNPVIREAAAYALGGAVEQPEVTQALLTTLTDQTLNPAIREQAASALLSPPVMQTWPSVMQRWKTPGTLIEQFDGGTIDLVTSIAQSSKWWRVRLGAIRVLSLLCKAGLVRPDVLFSQLRDSESGVREAATQGIVDLASSINRRHVIADQLFALLTDPSFQAVDYHQRPASDYAYDALFALFSDY